MGKKIASLHAEISADASKLQGTLKSSKAGLSQLAASFKSVTGFSIGATAAFGLAANTLRQAVKAAEESNRVNAVTVATLKATGRSASISASQIGDLALAESRLTSIDDEVVQSGMNMLLTFKGIGEDVLPRATKAMEDMAVAMAGGDTSALDLKGTAIQLGKALNDPIAGMTALKRVGVTFSEQQVAQIKNFMAVNDLASAQGVILSELESEFGGLSAAMGDTASGGVQKLKNEWGNLLEVMGQPIVAGRGSVIDVLTNGLINTSNTTTLARQINELASTGKLTKKQIQQAMQGLAMGDQSIAQGYVDTLYESLKVMADSGSNTFIFASGIRDVSSALEEQNDLLEDNIKTAGDSFTAALGDFTALQDAQKEYLTTTGNELASLLGGSMAEGSDKYRQGLQAIDDVMGTTLVKELEHKEAVKALADEYSRTGDLDKFKGGMEALQNVELKDLNEEMKDAAGSVEKLYAYWAALQGMPTTLNWSVFIDGMPSWLGSGGGKGGGQVVGNSLGAGGVTVKREANGGDFVVPPGYSNDSYLMGVQSGEHVSVTPVGGGGGLSREDISMLIPDYYQIARIIGQELQRVVR